MHHVPEPVSDAAVLTELAALPTDSMATLAARWQTLTGRPADRRNKRALIKRLAYAIQAAAWGGLSPDTQAQLTTLYRQHTPVPAPSAPLVGSALLREWHGEQHRVTVLPQGFEYAGRLYPSLSAVARAITGTRISGPAFFRVNGGAR
ncbi:MAG: hypothetical protein BWY76_01250 [bacterium ADurb.Bin429]|nr:MAG: hypothetical protein BWY76_01250 [bacterium ADurb.Bin429]